MRFEFSSQCSNKKLAFDDYNDICPKRFLFLSLSLSFTLGSFDAAAKISKKTYSNGLHLMCAPEWVTNARDHRTRHVDLWNTCLSKNDNNNVRKIGLISKRRICVRFRIITTVRANPVTPYPIGVCIKKSCRGIVRKWTVRDTSSRQTHVNKKREQQYNAKYASNGPTKTYIIIITILLNTEKK